MPSIAAAAGGIALAILLYKVINLARYIRQARSTGLPYVISPLLETEMVAFALTPILRSIYDKHLEKGQGWPRWCRFIIKDWSWEDKRRAHDEYGDVFLCVSPEGIICYSADAAMGWDVMNRRNDFTKPRDKYKILEPYGPNVATAEGATYRFHVRVTAPPFSDLSGVNDLVWAETLFQTKRLSQLWAENPTRDLDMDVNGLTLAVISRAGFGMSLHRGEEKQSSHREDINHPAGYKISFLQAIHGTTANMVSILMLPGWLLNLIPPMREAHVAHSQLGKYLRQMIRSERKRLQADENHQSSKARGNLLTAVMRSSFSLNVGDDSGKEANGGAGAVAVTAAPKVRKEAFTEDEVLGNLFIYLLAGYETTANAISYGLACLALHPDVQENVIKEVDSVYAMAEKAGSPDLSYTEHFDELQYLYGFMYEVFRLYPGVTLITKVALKPETITVTHHSSRSSSNSTTPRTTTHVLPPGTRVYLSAPAVHYHPTYWPDPTKLDPYRWINHSYTYNNTNTNNHNDNDSKTSTTVTAADKTRHMRGTLLTFSDGARSCLGRKFAQAEYVAFFAALLREYRVCFAEGVNPKVVKRDLDLKSAGKITLAPPYPIQLRLERR
ncbi:cytochrome P450 oxidoreductase [Naviculisporaceae sp. PSN 640]